jgi:hypothetical protein
MKVYVGEQTIPETLSLVPGKNLISGVAEIQKHFGTPTSLESDLLALAAGIYAADLATKRDYAENFIRSIELDVEVVSSRPETPKTLI